MSTIRAFLIEVDGGWRPPATDRIPLNIIGSTALMLQAQYVRGTKDSDILETATLTSGVKDQLLELAGPGSELQRKHRLYIEFVGAGLPFLPRLPIWHAVAGLENLRNFQIQALDIIDVVVSKFARFNANDAADIDAMIEKGLVSHDTLITRFRAAVEGFEMDSRADQLPRYLSRLHQVERDTFGVEPTIIGIPAGVGPE